MLPWSSLQRYAQDMLESLVFLDDCEVIHGDIKPENVCQDPVGDGHLKLIDLDSAIMIGENSDCDLQSQNYRAPEVTLGLQPYTCKTDVFSVGVILVELYRGELVNTLADAVARREQHPMLVHDLLDSMLPEGKDQDEITLVHFRSLVKSLLEPKPVSRISAKDALSHSFFSVRI